MTGLLLTNAAIATMGNGLSTGGAPYGLVNRGALAIEGGRIKWVGLTEEADAFPDFERRDLDGRLVTPALIDCHTHLVYGGHRAWEFEMRLKGATYEEVARAGGGIVSTVQSTRGASEQTLIDAALPRLDAMIGEGVATVEIKSGYGLDIETELTMLRAARRLAELRPVRVKTTFLGAHATPAEYKGSPEAYLKEVCLPALDAAAEERLVDAVDGFCEGIAFTPDQIAMVFARAALHHLPVKLHAEQLSNIGGARLAARHGALSADHLEYADAGDAAALAAAGTVAVLLPGAFYTIHETRRPPIDAFREAGVAMALATDCNPGSSPLASILLAMNMGCTLFHMTPEEALAGATRNAARALGLTDAGVVAPGMRADLALWDVEHPAELAYRIGFNALHERIFAGAET
ncbi:imidazolonepropionase [Pikeienuella piscinae]|uniref:Imidazolonepropionase n=1 Tax=Pikeienuella piscinae TaxID=2748098 RepID=A0A7L5BSS3_9RHOB|nr:imidazolonepropionase [Pikeienuella piscinae]QIE54700.1 imidazolonepropionase [Pikeienuella piscinae]